MINSYEINGAEINAPVVGVNVDPVPFPYIEPTHNPRLRVGIDVRSYAAKNFYKLVRNFALRTKPWEAALFYETKPNEKHDFTLISRLIYGRPDEYLAVMAAAGIDRVDQELKQKRIVLPTDAQLHAMKRRSGFESIGQYRKNGVPTWAN